MTSITHTKHVYWESLKLALSLLLEQKSIVFFQLSEKKTLAELFSIKVFIEINSFFKVNLHYRMGTLFYSPQVLEFFSYQAAAITTNVLYSHFFFTQTSLNLSMLTLVTDERTGDLQALTAGKYKKRNSIPSLDKIFQNYWWMEREASEMHDLSFNNKSDARNLLLEYLTVLKPMLRSFPSYGLYELFYDTLRSIMIHRKTSLQF